MKKVKSKERYKNTDQSITKSFKHAFEGLRYSFFAESNMLIHFLMIVIVLLASAVLQLNTIEWILVILISFIVIAAELINTSIEVLIDMLEPEYNPLAKIAKDCSAAAVMVLSFAAVIIGVIIFLPKILEMIFV